LIRFELDFRHHISLTPSRNEMTKMDRSMRGRQGKSFIKNQNRLKNKSQLLTRKIFVYLITNKGQLEHTHSVQISGLDWVAWKFP
jgi:hypothetical protein